MVRKSIKSIVGKKSDSICSVYFIFGFVQKLQSFFFSYPPSKTSHIFFPAPLQIHGPFSSIIFIACIYVFVCAHIFLNITCSVHVVLFACVFSVSIVWLRLLCPFPICLFLAWIYPKIKGTNSESLTKLTSWRICGPLQPGRLTAEYSHSFQSSPPVLLIPSPPQITCANLPPRQSPHLQGVTQIFSRKFPSRNSLLYLSPNFSRHSLRSHRLLWPGKQVD